MKVFITYRMLVGRFELFRWVLVSVDADIRTTLAAVGLGLDLVPFLKLAVGGSGMVLPVTLTFHW